VKDRRVVFSPESATDLIKLYDWIAAQASPQVATVGWRPSAVV
jgi:plasmid stabilization system protein ParE